MEKHYAKKLYQKSLFVFFGYVSENYENLNTEEKIKICIEDRNSKFNLIVSLHLSLKKIFFENEGEYQNEVCRKFAKIIKRNDPEKTKKLNEITKLLGKFEYPKHLFFLNEHQMYEKSMFLDELIKSYDNFSNVYSNDEEINFDE